MIQKKQILEKAKEAIIRDLDLDKHFLITTLISFNLSLLYFTHTFLNLQEIYDNVNNYLLFFLAIASFATGGILTDRDISPWKIYNACNLSGVLTMALYLFLPAGQPLWGSIFLYFTGIHVFFTIFIFISQTSMLNRGRKCIIMLYLGLGTYGAFFGIFIYLDYSQMFLFYLFLGLIPFDLLWRWKNPFPLEKINQYSSRVDSIYHLDIDVDEIKDDLTEIIAKEKEEKKEEIIEDLGEHIKKITLTWFKTFVNTGLVFVLAAACILAGVLGFNIVVFQVDFDSVGSAAIYVILIMSVVFLTGIALDIIGRKPIALVTAGIVGIFLLFLDIYNTELYNPLMFMFVPVIASLGIMFFLSYLGDVSDTYKRGGMVAIALIIVCTGLFIGIILSQYLEITADEITTYNAILIADISTLLVIVCLMLLNFTPETFEISAILWRSYLDRILITTHTGTNLFFHNFKESFAKKERENDKSKGKDEKKERVDKGRAGEGGPNEDLISGGLSGMQSLLKEISMSSEKLQVLDHGDKKFLFAHGEYSTTVLITSKDLKLLRMKISKFHNEFEKTNGEILKNFTGKISQLKGINSLMDNVFKTDLDE